MVGEIKIMGVKKEFRRADGELVHALNGVDLTIAPGEFVSLIGPSGCGKSTLLRLLAGLDRPTEGSIYLDGEAVSKPNCDRGLVFQDHTLFPWLNIQENVAFGLKARKLYKEQKESVAEYLDMVGLTGFERSYPHQLSGGMCQRASLARALIGHPKVLLLDEPLGALDAFTRMNMQDEILNIWMQRKQLALMVTHSIDEAVYMGTRVLVMETNPGRIVADIKIDEDFPRDRSSASFVEYRNEILNKLHYGGKTN